MTSTSDLSVAPQTDITHMDRAELGKQIESARTYLQSGHANPEQAQALNLAFPARIVLQKRSMRMLDEAGFSREEYSALRRKLDGELNPKEPAPTRKLFADAGLSDDVLQQKALTLAVWVLVCEAVIALLSVLLRAASLQLVTFAVEAALAFGLQRGLRWARPATLLIMSVGLIFVSVSVLSGAPPLGALLYASPYVAVLLLLGKAQPWRLMFARCVLIVIIFLTAFALVAELPAVLN